MSTWLTFIAVGLGSYALRSSFLVLFAGRSVPARHEATLALVGPAAIGALVASMTFSSAGSFEMPAVAELAAVAAGFVAVRRTGKLALAFVAGLPTLWALTWLVG